MNNVITQKSILEILDWCATEFTFPFLDNGYVYLAESRLTVFRSAAHWAITIEIFGFSPRVGDPDVTVYTFSNALRNRSKIDDFVSKEAYDNYLAKNKFNEYSSFWPLGGENWIDPEDPELCMAEGEYELRNKRCSLPRNKEYEAVGIKLEEDRPAVFEFCRYLAHHEKELVLATGDELIHHVPIDCEVRLQLADWCHPDISGSELPSSKETFQLIASLIETDKLSSYSSIEAPNTHWSNWPDSGTL